jgi:hypothetical protein
MRRRRMPEHQERLRIVLDFLHFPIVDLGLPEEEK